MSSGPAGRAEADVRNLTALQTMHLTLGGGVELTPAVALAGAVTTLSDLLERRYAGGDHFYHVATASLRWSRNGVGVGGRVSLPLDDELREQVSPSLGIEVTGRF